MRWTSATGLLLRGRGGGVVEGALFVLGPERGVEVVPVGRERLLAVGPLGESSVGLVLGGDRLDGEPTGVQLAVSHGVPPRRHARARPTGRARRSPCPGPCASRPPS